MSAKIPEICQACIKRAIYALQYTVPEKNHRSEYFAGGFNVLQWSNERQKIQKEIPVSVFALVMSSEQTTIN